MGSYHKILGSLVLAGVLASPIIARAQLASITPFAGNRMEDWESFPNFNDPAFHLLANTSSIMGGKATVNNDLMTIFESFVADASLGNSGFATPKDGAKGLKVSDTAVEPLIFVFSEPLTDFEAYWGAETTGSPITVSLSFFDPMGNLFATNAFDYDREIFGDGVLEWHGWSSSQPIGRVDILGVGVAVDSLQAQAVPEASSFALFVGLGVFCSILNRKRKI